MKKYIFGERNGIYIINLEITLSCIEKALKFLKEIAAQGRDILWVGTKKQAQEAIDEYAKKCTMPFVNQRWLGGMLTNFETVRKSIKRLELIDKMELDGSFQFITKKEASSLRKEREKLSKVLTGICEMKRLPGAIFVIDSKKEEIAIHEAAKLNIPIVSVLDTNCDPDLVDYPLPGNDDAIRAIKLFCELVSTAIQEGRAQFHKVAEAQAASEKDQNEEDAGTGSEETPAPQEAEDKNLAANVAGPSHTGPSHPGKPRGKAAH